MFVHPPYLKRPTRDTAEHLTAEAADEVCARIEEEVEQIVTRLRKQCNNVRTATLRKAFLELCVLYEVEESDVAPAGVDVDDDVQYSIVTDAYDMSHRLYASAKQAVAWVESREPHHFQDDVNSKDTIECAVQRLEEVAGYYGDPSMEPPTLALCFGCFPQYEPNQAGHYRGEKGGPHGCVIDE